MIIIKSCFSLHAAEIDVCLANLFLIFAVSFSVGSTIPCSTPLIFFNLSCIQFISGLFLTADLLIERFYSNLSAISSAPCCAFTIPFKHVVARTVSITIVIRNGKVLWKHGLKQPFFSL